MPLMNNSGIRASLPSGAVTYENLFVVQPFGNQIVVLLLSGGLNSLQAGAIATGLPLALVLLLMCWGTLKGLFALHRAGLEAGTEAQG